TFMCALDGAAAAPCPAEGMSYDGLAPGAHRFAVQAVDGAGNADPTPAVADWTIDLSAPVARIDDKPASPTRDTRATLAFSAGERATFRCWVDDGPRATCASPATYADLAAGPHRFAVQAIDASGNVGPVAVAAWTIDLTPPETTLVDRPAAIS